MRTLPLCAGSPGSNAGAAFPGLSLVARSAWLYQINEAVSGARRFLPSTIALYIADLFEEAMYASTHLRPKDKNAISIA